MKGAGSDMTPNTTYSDAKKNLLNKLASCDFDDIGVYEVDGANASKHTVATDKSVQDALKLANQQYSKALKNLAK